MKLWIKYTLQGGRNAFDYFLEGANALELAIKFLDWENEHSSYIVLAKRIVTE